MARYQSPLDADNAAPLGLCLVVGLEAVGAVIVGADLARDAATTDPFVLRLAAGLLLVNVAVISGLARLRTWGWYLFYGFFAVQAVATVLLTNPLLVLGDLPGVCYLYYRMDLYRDVPGPGAQAA